MGKTNSEEERWFVFECVEVMVILSNSTGAGRVVSIGSEANRLMASSRGVVIMFI
jgi:hypothetical protein